MPMFSRKLGKVLLFVVLCLVGAGVYLSIWAEKRASQILGPTMMRESADGDIWIKANHQLYRLGADGELLRIIMPLNLGLNDLTDLLPLASGEFLIGDKTTNEIRRYSPDEELLHSFVARTIREGERQGTFKFIIDSETGDYYVVDTINHRILRFDKDGAHKGEFGRKESAESNLHFPNQIALGPDQRLYIIDTNNHRISIRDKNGTHLISIPTTTSRNKIENIWPTYFGFLPDDRLAVINKGPDLTGGELAVVSLNEGIIQKITLPPGTNPVDIVVRSGDMLVTDEAQMLVLRFSHEGEFLDPFGNDTFKKTLAKTYSEREQYRSITKKARIGLFFLLFILLGLLFIERRRERKEIGRGDPLHGHLNLRVIPFEKIASAKKWLFYGMAGAAVVGCFLVPLLVFMHLRASNRINLPILFAVVIAFPTLFLSLFFILGRGIKRGLFIEGELKKQNKALKNFGPVLAKALMPTEKIRMYSIAKRLPCGAEPFLRGSLTGIEMLFLVITESRILLLNTDALLSRLRRIREIGFDGISEVKIGPRTLQQKSISKLGGGKQLTLVPLGNREPIDLQFVWDRQAEEIKREIEERKAVSRSSFTGIRQLCKNCYSPILISQFVCPTCRKPTASRYDPALLSLIYPGLGQFSNDSILKGVVFLISTTASLYLLLLYLYTSYHGTAEVDSRELIKLIMYLLAFWIGSVADAYYASKK